MPLPKLCSQFSQDKAWGRLKNGFMDFKKIPNTTLYFPMCFLQGKRIRLSFQRQLRGASFSRQLANILDMRLKGFHLFLFVQDVIFQTVYLCHSVSLKK